MSLHLATGTVWHSRSKPKEHSFSYPMSWILADIDAMDRDPGNGNLLGPGFPGLLRMRIRDHLDGKGETWRESLSRWLPAMSLPEAPKVDLLTLPSFLGRTFNPVSFWFGKDAQGEILWMIAEVNNTFGERHLYRLAEPRVEDSRMTWTAPKAFPVSPFHGVDGTYRFGLSRNGSGMILEIDLVHPDGSVFRTGMDLQVRPATRGGLRLAFPHLAISVLMVVPRILWQASRLHFGGKAAVQPRSPSVAEWTIHRTKPVFLQRILANRSAGRLWRRLGGSKTNDLVNASGAIHGI
ncbi:MAG: DUF1365 domain-containing protein [Fibrobacteria bacterium]|nr:DUF1365 domain-containing protein [Fibrobacteria bacterium]